MCAALWAVSPGANAVIVYDWHGKCNVGCDGTANATLYLDAGYEPGASVAPFDGSGSTVILGFDWYLSGHESPSHERESPDSHRYKIFGSALNPLALPRRSGTGAGTIFSFGGFTETVFATSGDGSWQFGSGFSLSSACSQTRPSGGCRGTSGEWVLRAVPEPATDTLLGLGLVALAGLRKRKPLQ
jgi:hypothetical protein